VVQEISFDGSLELKIDNLRETAQVERQARTKIIEGSELAAHFDLEVGPLIRARLIQLSDLENVLLITMHHIVSDGWSLGIIQRELSELYSGYLEGRGDGLPHLPYQYGDYVRWEQQWLQGSRLDRQLSYWKKRLEGAAPRLELPTDRPRPAEQTYRGASIPIEIDPALASKLKMF